MPIGRIPITLLLFTLAVSLSANDPVILFHGMGDQCVNKGMAGFTKLIGQSLDTYSVCIEVGNGASTSLFRNFSEQAVEACDKITQDPQLKGNVSVVGLSQGALLGRWVIQNCPGFQGKVRRYLSIGGPHMGVARIPGCFKGRICNLISWLVDGLVYHRYFQRNVGPAGYFHNFKDEQKYLDKSAFLPKLNYDTNKSQAGYQKLLETHMMLVMFDKDSMIYPKESSWFMFFDAKGSLMSFFGTPHYTQEKLPLREMFEQKRLTFVRIEGDHLQFTNADIEDFFLPFLRGDDVRGEHPDSITTEQYQEEIQQSTNLQNPGMIEVDA